jgi:hypothetical protein
MLLNPLTPVWYWYIWKRGVFIALFSPLLGIFLLLPFVTRSLLSKAEETFLTKILFALGNGRLVILLTVLLMFPLCLRLMALVHLGKNSELRAIDRNDWIVSLALPIFGFGSAIAYCAKYRRRWALIGLLWIAVMGVVLKGVTLNIAQALLPVGEERREEFRAQREV